MVQPRDGRSRLPEYKIWVGMRQRCSNPNSTSYPHYGGRGIYVCERWNDFLNFYADMGTRPSPDLTIDRVNNDGPYEKSNCRWATRSQQQANKRRPTYKTTLALVTQNPQVAELGVNELPTRADGYNSAKYQRALRSAPRRHRNWTEDEVRTAMRTDLSPVDAALMTGRTPGSIADVRRRVRQAARKAGGGSATVLQLPRRATPVLAPRPNRPAPPSRPQIPPSSRVGVRSGRLRIIALIDKWCGLEAICRCDCGREVSTPAERIASGVRTHCGCRDQLQKPARKIALEPTRPTVHLASAKRAAPLPVKVDPPPTCNDDRPHAPHGWRRPQGRDRLHCGGVA